MSTTLLITLPHDKQLIEEIERSLARHATVERQPPQTLGLETVALIVTIAAGTTTFINGLLEIREKLHAHSKASQASVASPVTGEQRTLADVDEPFLRGLLDVADQ